MHPILFHIGSFTLYTYGLFVALGFMTAILVSQNNAKPYGISSQAVSDLFFIILLSALFGARFLYVLINFDFFKNNLMDIFKFWNGGLVFWGGFIAAVPAAAVYLTRKKIKIWQTADILSPGIALGHAVGRMGCLFAGCCYGKECNLAFAIKFTNPDSLAPLGVYLHPTQIYSVISNLILFFVLSCVLKRKKFDGMVFLSYIMLYSIFRFIIEFFRGDFRGDFFFEFISLSQGIGVVAFMVALIFLIKQSISFYGHR